MKVITVFIVSLFAVVMAGSCSKPTDDAMPTAFPGEWTLSEIYGNDVWGGPAYWKPAVGDTRIRFTQDGRYYRKDFADSVFTLIGTFKILSDSAIEITQDKPLDPSVPSYILYYSFSDGGYMTWGNFGFEALIKEKYRLEQADVVW